MGGKHKVKSHKFSELHSFSGLPEYSTSTSPFAPTFVQLTIHVDNWYDHLFLRLTMFHIEVFSGAQAADSTDTHMSHLSLPAIGSRTRSINRFLSQFSFTRLKSESLLHKTVSVENSPDDAHQDFQCSCTVSNKNPGNLNLNSTSVSFVFGATRRTSRPTCIILSK